MSGCKEFPNALYNPNKFAKPVDRLGNSGVGAVRILINTPVLLVRPDGSQLTFPASRLAQSQYQTIQGSDTCLPDEFGCGCN